MATLPYPNLILSHSPWQIAEKATVMESGGAWMKVTQGLRPWVETTSIEWLVTATEMAEIIGVFKAARFNGSYDYTHTVMGAVKLRPNGRISFEEPDNGTEKMVLRVEFRVV